VENATYFRSEDYAGAAARLAIVVIDSVVLVGGLIVLVIISMILDGFVKGGEFVWYLLFPPFCLLYLGLLHASRFGTIGYLLLGYKLVDYRGKRPALWRELVRGSLLLILPFEVISDVTGSRCPYTRQQFWDRIAETAVVRKGAQPVGQTALVSHFEFSLGLNWVTREANLES
jgi:hypothetical protein